MNFPLLDMVYEALGSDKDNWAHTLLRYLETMEEKYKKHDTPNFPLDDTDVYYYNKHDFDHIKRVCRYVGKLIQALSLELNVDELLTLFFATVGHDVAMCEVAPERIMSYVEKWGRNPTGDEWRRMHGHESARIIREYMKNETRGSDIIAKTVERIEEPVLAIIWNHGEEDEENIKVEEENNIRTPLLLALLRIADTCDATYKRLPYSSVIGWVIARAAVRGEPYIKQIEHYLRRLICSKVELGKGGSGDKAIISIHIYSNFRECRIMPLKEVKFSLHKEPITGEEAFEGLLSEFEKELGPPNNINNMESLNAEYEKQISSKLLEKYGKKLEYKILFEGDYNYEIEIEEIIRKSIEYAKISLPRAEEEGPFTKKLRYAFYNVQYS